MTEEEQKNGEFFISAIDEEQYEEENPELLLSDVKKSKMPLFFIVSLAVHVVVVLLMSIGDINLCVKYGTINVSEAHDRDVDAKKKEKEELMADEAAKKKAERKLKAKEAKREELLGKPKSNKPGKKLTPIEKATSEKSNERPAVGLGGGLDNDFE
jgi:hypothetical protein